MACSHRLYSLFDCYFIALYVSFSSYPHSLPPSPDPYIRPPFYPSLYSNAYLLIYQPTYLSIYPSVQFPLFLLLLLYIPNHPTIYPTTQLFIQPILSPFTHSSTRLITLLVIVIISAFWLYCLLPLLPVATACRRVVTNLPVFYYVLCSYQHCALYHSIILYHPYFCSLV